MPTSDERRRVAQALREMETPTWPTLTEAVMGHAATRDKVVGRLAELIERDTTTDTTKTVEDTTKHVCDATATVTDTSATRDMSQSCRSDIDRDALMALAEEMDRHADMAAGHVAYAARFDFAGWARRIREALGVQDV